MCCSGLEAFGRVHAYTLLTTVARVDDESPLAECKRLGLALRTLSVQVHLSIDGDVNNSVPPRPAQASLASPSSSGDDVAVVVVVVVVAVAVVVVAVVSAALLSRSVKTTATVLGDVT
ncbi:hypothetical protein G5I_05457 [Acromyrmex echinatior]|uniref:Uncharacterized protein n=1 Tax=Acromyrmex echinatior TaxID=103372 RepID=F4WID4_ACREC|nr:hypothetical protein G5I_05457 [Acromyrmex echinatior]